MQRITTLAELRERVAVGENQRQEFKTCTGALDGTFKNKLVFELAALANGGGGTLFLGVEDATPHEIVGIPVAEAEKLARSGDFVAYFSERVSPLPDLDVYCAPGLSAERATVVFTVSSPWESAMPIYAPVILTQDIQDENKRLKAARGSIPYRDGVKTERVGSHRQWDGIMRPVLTRFEADRLVPLLSQLRDQELVLEPWLDAGEPLKDRFSEEFGPLSRNHPNAAIFDCRLALENTMLTRKEQHELIDKSSVPRRGWPVPPYIARLVAPGTEGQLTFLHYDRPPFQVDPEMRHLQEFWHLTPQGLFVSGVLSAVDLMTSIDGVPQPDAGPQRPLDAIEVCEQVLGFLMFARNAAGRSKSRSLWVRVAIHNVMNRPIGASLDAEAPIRARLWARPGEECNLTRIVQEGRFAPAVLASDWRHIAVSWNHEILTRLGRVTDEDEVRRLHDRLLELYSPNTQR